MGKIGVEIFAPRLGGLELPSKRDVFRLAAAEGRGFLRSEKRPDFDNALKQMRGVREVRARDHAKLRAKIRDHRAWRRNPEARGIRRDKKPTGAMVQPEFARMDDGKFGRAAHNRADA